MPNETLSNNLIVHVPCSHYRYVHAFYIQAEAGATSAKEETAHYKKLTETLKQKLRDLSDHSGDNQAFLDTFEEVCELC